MVADTFKAFSVVGNIVPKVYPVVILKGTYHSFSYLEEVSECPMWKPVINL